MPPQLCPTTRLRLHGPGLPCNFRLRGQTPGARRRCHHPCLGRTTTILQASFLHHGPTTQPLRELEEFPRSSYLPFRPLETLIQQPHHCGRQRLTCRSPNFARRSSSRTLSPTRQSGQNRFSSNLNGLYPSLDGHWKRQPDRGVGPGIQVPLLHSPRLSALGTC